MENTMTGYEQSTDGKLDGWDCNVTISGEPRDKDHWIHAAAYTMGDNDTSAPHEIEMRIEDLCKEDFKTYKEARAFVVKAGFVPAGRWGGTV
jgi:hypothetical protein